MINLKEKTINTKNVYKGKFLEVNKDRLLLPNGKNGYREWVNHPGTICYIPVLPDGKIIMVR